MRHLQPSASSTPSKMRSFSAATPAAAFALSSALLSACPAVAETREIWYDITTATANPDGLFERQVFGLNNSWPPPPIEINEGDKLVVHATNKLSVNTAIHHHGMFFNATSWFDGAVGVTQCGIPPGQTFTYEVDTVADGQTGTYWYHSHFGGQYGDGLRAPLIIHRQQEPHAYDEDITVNLFDWYHDSYDVLVKQFLAESNPTGAEPVPNSGIIHFSQNGQYLPGFSENTNITFTPGRTYRLRIINMSALAMFSFWIDGHDMRVIEVDGTDVEEYPIDLVTVSVAQRVSVLVTARNETESNWLIHANMSPDMFDVVPDDLKLNITSTAVYSPTASTQPGTEVEEYTEFPDQELVPVIVQPELEANVNIELGVFFDTSTDGTNRAFFNNITYQTPVVPAYLTVVSMGADAYDPKIYGQTNSFVLNMGDVVNLKVINWDAGFHPFHLHGAKMQLVAESYDVSSDDRTINPDVPEGLANPMRRDTFMVPPEGGARTVRWKVDNPGTWFFHCHIEWHLSSGLAVVFVQAPDVMQQQIGAPDYLKEQCASLGFATSGNAAGWNSTTDFRGLTVGPYPQSLGWHAKGIVAMVGCIITALLGIATVIWYALGGQLDEDEMKLEVAAAVQRKEARKGKSFKPARAQAAKIKGLFNRH